MRRTPVPGKIGDTQGVKNNRRARLLMCRSLLFWLGL